MEEINHQREILDYIFSILQCSKFITDKYGYSESSAVPSYFAGIFFGLSTAGCFLAGKFMVSDIEW